MGLLSLLPYHSNLLREKAVEIPLPAIFMDQIVPDLYETMYFYNGIGLASPQVGRSQRLAVIDTGKEKLVLVNPEICKISDEMVDNEEKCLSCPGISVTIPRYKEILLKNFDLDGNECTHHLTDMLALVTQHEIDHLDGILITDRLSSLKKYSYLQKLSKRNQT